MNYHHFKTTATPALRGGPKGSPAVTSTHKTRRRAFGCPLKAGMAKIFFLLLLVSFAGAPCLAQTPGPPNKSVSLISDEKLKQQGNLLRTAIDQEYKKVYDVSTVKMGSKEVGNDLTAVVMQYIPLGISFDDAEQILRNAGFKIRPRPKPNTPRVGIEGSEADVRRFDEVAVIEPYIAANASAVFGLETGIYVCLSPQASQRYTKVLKVHAFIAVSSL